MRPMIDILVIMMSCHNSDILTGNVLEGDIGVNDSVVGLEENERELPSIVPNNSNDKVAEATASMQISETPNRFTSKIKKNRSLHQMCHQLLVSTFSGLVTIKLQRRKNCEIQKQDP